MTAPVTSSLQARLAWRLGLVLVGSLSLVVSTLLYYVWTILDDLDDASFQIQARQITDNLVVQDGAVDLNLPTALKSAYQQSGDGFLFALKHRDGHVLVSSSAKARNLIDAVALQLLRI